MREAGWAWSGGGSRAAEGGVGDGEGEGSEGKGRGVIQLRQQISTEAQCQCQGAECAVRGENTHRLSFFLKSKIASCTNTLFTYFPAKFNKWTNAHSTETQIQTHTFKPDNLSALKCLVALFPLRRLLSLPFAPLYRAVHNLLSAETNWQDKTHSFTIRPNGLHCALITRPAGMPFDLKTHSVWPALDWWEWTP